MANVTGQFEHIQPNLILVDLGPATTTLATIGGQVRTINATRESLVPVSALAEQSDRIHGFAQGFRMMLNRPIKIAELVAAIASFMGRLG